MLTCSDAELLGGPGPALSARARTTPAIVVAIPDGSAPTRTEAHPLGAAPVIVLSGPRAAGDPTHHLDAIALGDIADLDELCAAIAAHPDAATALALLQRDGSRRGLGAGLIAESTTYSLLQSGAEFAGWLQARSTRSARVAEHEPVLVRRHGDHLEITLNRPQVHNALNAATFQALSDALTVALVDPSIAQVDGRGTGPTFCSGGDLDEFGTFVDPTSAHLLRLARHPGPLIAALGDRITFHLHGACRGSGVELPAFAGRVLAHPDTTFALPEVTMGLIPGAGGTWSITRRIGRLRATSLALSGAVLDADRALEWGLIDAIVDA